MRKAILGLGLLVIGWFLLRRSRSSDGSAIPGGERVSQTIPDVVPVPGGGTEEATPEEDMSVDTDSDMTLEEDAADTSVPASESAPGVDESMSGEEVEERVDSEADTDPAPPGGMNVDEDVVEEVVEESEEDPHDSGTTTETESSDRFGDDTDEQGAQGPDIGDPDETAADTEIDDDEEMLGQDETDMEADEPDET